MEGLQLMEIKENPFKIIVKTGSNKNEVIGYDENRQAYKVAISALPENNKANIEIIKFFSKLLKKRVYIIKGIRNKEKILKIG